MYNLSINLRNDIALLRLQKPYLASDNNNNKEPFGKLPSYGMKAYRKSMILKKKNIINFKFVITK